MASRRIANLHKIYLYLIEHPCVDCGENDPVVLEFDHIRDKKAFTIGSCLHYDWSKIENEIAKCEIRCSNCHKRKTAREQNWGILRFCKTSP